MRSHRVLVYLDDFDDDECWGAYCIDCDLHNFGSPTDIYPTRVAKKHVKATRPVLVEVN